MNQNPYDSPTHVNASPTARRSRRPYFIASSIVLILFVAMAAIVGWQTNVNIADDEIWFQIPGRSVSTSPSGDPVIAYDRIIYTSLSSVAVLWTILLSVALAIVNGSILIWRR